MGNKLIIDIRNNILNIPLSRIIPDINSHKLRIRVKNQNDIAYFQDLLVYGLQILDPSILFFIYDKKDFYQNKLNTVIKSTLEDRENTPSLRFFIV